jgi:uncharacterized glyoxalase superfamily protein PhnB
MPANTPIPTVAPMLAYEHAAAALVWLTKAFGFRERTRITMPDGLIGHAEMEIGDGIIMLAEPDPTAGAPSGTPRPARQPAAGGRCRTSSTASTSTSTTSAPTSGRRAKPGRRSCPSPKTAAMGGRSYRTAGLEGHRWMFTQRPPAAAPDEQ